MTTGVQGKNFKDTMRAKASSSSSSPSSLRYKRLCIARPNVLHQYLRHKSINQYLDYIKQRYSTFVQLYTLGSSYEGRRLKAIEIDWNCERNLRAQSKRNYRWKPALKIPKDCDSQTHPTVKGSKRDVIFIEGGSHGREWLSISAALNVVHQLTEKHFRNMSLLKNFRFFIVPISNPDGYEYTLDKNLRWRKNRRPTSPNSKYIGIDCNRNYDFHWEKGSTKQSSYTYKGEKPFSELETRAVNKALQTLQPNILLFISLHSYAQSIMYPWGCSKDEPLNLRELQMIASAGSYAMKTFSGRSYRTGSIAELSKHTIGGSIVDYAYGVINAPFAYVMELPDSKYGFQPPAHFIRPIGQESWIGIREMCHCAHTLHSNSISNEIVLQNLQSKYQK